MKVAIRVLMLIFGIVGISATLQAAENTFIKELRELDALRIGLETPADKVEARGAELLAQYSAPEQQALVHYQLAHVHAQSGQIHPELVADHAQKALALPLGPVERLQLYIYHGDALQLINRSRTAAQQLPFPLTRKTAAEAYLKGLKETKQYSLPAERPEMPARDRPFEVPRGSGAQYQEALRRANEEEKKYSAALQQARVNQALWDNRKILYGQLADIYARPPADTAELRSLATGILQDDSMVAAVLGGIEVSPRRTHALAATPPGVETIELPAPRRRVGILLTANIALLILLAAIWFWRRHRAST